MSRVSTAQVYHNTQQQVLGARERETISGEKASTQKEIVRPSQDPRGWVVATNLKDNLSIRETVSKNAALAMHVLNTNETMLSQLHDFVGRAHELAVATAGTAASAQKRELILSEVRNLYGITLQTLNTRYGDRTLLAGFRTDIPAFDDKGLYQGDQGVVEIEIDRGVRVPLNISAEKWVNGKGIQNGIDIIDSFQKFMKGLDTNEVTLVQESVANFLHAIDQVSAARAEVGARMTDIDRALESHSLGKVDAQEAISKIEEVDAIKAFSDLARDQAVLNASMLSTHKIISETSSDVLFR